MYNSLKEMLDAVSKEELLKYSKELINKSPIEIIKEILKSYNIELSDNAANECYEYLNAVNALSDEKLENVIGGYSSYSSNTYEELGIWPDSARGQTFLYHPLITTVFNTCGLSNGATFCLSCE